MFVTLALMVSSVALLNATPVSATGLYDEALATVDELKYGAMSNPEDVTHSYLKFFSGCDPSYLASFQTALASGYWSVLQVTANSALGGTGIHPTYGVQINWSDVAKGEVVFIPAGEPNFPFGGVGLEDNSNVTITQKVLRTMPHWDTGELYVSCQNYGYMPMSWPFDDGIFTPDRYVSAIFSNTYPVNYPEDYEGELVPLPNINADHDGDGLNALREMQQGTLDNNPDTDGDGIDDFKESIWFPDRDDVFCDTSTSPYTCAYPDPKKKDLYVEVDWMYDPVANRSFKPTSTQIAKLEGAFTAKDINFHADTGQFGGGNELQSYEEYLHITSSPSHVDFADFKNGHGSYPANYSPNRNGVWRYMISGYRMHEYPNVSGLAEVGGSDSFISNGLVEDTFAYFNLDDAIAGTMIHELGHNLCLNKTLVYEQQPSLCAYSGVDSLSGGENYLSSMNYAYQVFMVDYSDGSHGSHDHDDWSAVMQGISLFTKTHTPLSALGKSNEKDGLAFDINTAAPSELTPELSKKIYEQKLQEKKQSTDSNTPPSSEEEENNPSQNKSEESNTDTRQPSGFNLVETSHEGLTPEKSMWVLVMWVAPVGVAVVGLVFAAVSVVRRRKKAGQRE